MDHKVRVFFAFSVCTSEFDACVEGYTVIIIVDAVRHKVPINIDNKNVSIKFCNIGEIWIEDRSEYIFGSLKGLLVGNTASNYIQDVIIGRGG